MWHSATSESVKGWISWCIFCAKESACRPKLWSASLFYLLVPVSLPPPPPPPVLDGIDIDDVFMSAKECRRRTHIVDVDKYIADIDSTADIDTQTHMEHTYDLLC